MIDPEVNDKSAEAIKEMNDRWTGPDAYRRREFETDPLKGLTRRQRFWGLFLFSKVRREDRRLRKIARKRVKQFEKMDERDRKAAAQSYLW